MGQSPGLAEMAMERLEAQICALAGRRAADECAWLLLIGEFDRREGYWAWDCRSSAYWLSWHCGLSTVAGRERVRVARALEHLPLVVAHFAAGRLTYSKVRAITRVATAATEEMLVDLALAATAAQLERICAAYRRVDRRDPDGNPLDEETHAAARAERVGVDVWHDDDGLTNLRAVLAPEDGALVEAALAAAQDHLTTSADHPDDAGCIGSDSAGTPRTGPTRAQALVELARAYLSTTPGSPHIERRHLLVQVDVGALTSDGTLGIDPNGRCTLNGQRITPDTARRLAVSASLTTVLIDHRGLPLSVGRRSRLPTPAQRLALHIRDQAGCRWPGCPNRRVDAHHLHEWERGGCTDQDNLCQFCRTHHRLIHATHAHIRLDPDTGAIHIRRSDGTPITAPTPTRHQPPHTPTRRSRHPPPTQRHHRLPRLVRRPSGSAVEWGLQQLIRR